MRFVFEQERSRATGSLTGDELRFFGIESHLDTTLRCRADITHVKCDTACSKNSRRFHESFFDHKRDAHAVEQLADVGELFLARITRAKASHRCTDGYCSVGH